MAVGTLVEGPTPATASHFRVIKNMGWAEIFLYPQSQALERNTQNCCEAQDNSDGPSIERRLYPDMALRIDLNISSSAYNITILFNLLLVFSCNVSDEEYRYK